MRLFDLETIADILRNDAETHYQRVPVVVPLSLSPSSYAQLEKDIEKNLPVRLTVPFTNPNPIDPNVTSLMLRHVTFHLTII